MHKPIKKLKTNHISVFPTFLTPWYWYTFEVIAANLFALAYWIVIYSYLSDLKTPVKPVSLFDAIAKGNLKKIESLLKQGVNPNIRDKDAVAQRGVFGPRRGG
jgi:hypothetical protein